MVRVKWVVNVYKKCCVIFECVFGYCGQCLCFYWKVKEQVIYFLVYLYWDCCKCKGDFCCFWIQCINVVVCQNGMIYNCFIQGFGFVGVMVDCCMFVDFVVNDVVMFMILVEMVKKVLFFDVNVLKLVV